jgi:hypothetical protein
MGDIREKLRSRRVLVTDSPTLIADNLEYKNSVLLTNLSGFGDKIEGGSDDPITIYLDGDKFVNTSSGYPLLGCDKMVLGFQEKAPQVPGFHRIQLWGICSSGNFAEIAILEGEGII